MSYAVCKALAVPFEEFFDYSRKEMQLLVEGDDSALSCNSQLKTKVLEFYLKGVGLKTVIDEGNFTKFNFLKVHIVDLGSELVPVKDPTQQLCRLFINPK